MKISEVEARGLPCCHPSAGSARANAVVFPCCTHVAEQHVFAHCSPQSTQRGWNCSGEPGREGRLVSEGLRSAAVSYVGRLCLAVRRVCRGAAQGVQALECRGAAGKSPCLEERQKSKNERETQWKWHQGKIPE